MSLINKLRAELIDIVEWVDDSRHTLVWRFPRYHNQIKHGAQLIVRPGQQADLCHRRKDRGRLRTRSVSHWKLQEPTAAQHHRGLEVRFRQPLQVRSLFRQYAPDRRPQMGNPQSGDDARSRTLATSGSGPSAPTPSRRSDPKTLLTELVGTDSEFESDEISELLRSIVNMSFADVVAKVRDSRSSTSPPTTRISVRRDPARLVDRASRRRVRTRDPPALRRQHLRARRSRAGPRCREPASMRSATWPSIKATSSVRPCPSPPPTRRVGSPEPAWDSAWAWESPRRWVRRRRRSEAHLPRRFRSLRRRPYPTGTSR